MRSNPANNPVLYPKQHHSLVVDKIKSMQDVRDIFAAIGLGFKAEHPNFNKIKHLLTKEATH